MLGQLESHGRIIVADFEAGLGTLSRIKEPLFDILLVVFEPTAKAIHVVHAALEMVRERAPGRTILVANRVRSEEDRRLVAEAFPDRECIAIADDALVRHAGVIGAAAIDEAPHSPAVMTISSMARSFV